MILAEPVALDSLPRSRRGPYVGVTGGRILIGIASPIIPALENQWPSWLAPIGGGWKPAAPRSGNSRRGL